ncbi:AI-2E family transporter [Rhodohalobacter sp. SW132]|uniref:AI-2E family transporter n=1 Tax=Rhodohalobacter sp. SW132 TaxID=2293433 RepID=UPI000E266E6D|nr:AI-2E family transporter [Rhodohalobacter sp. SW132]REL39013.1 AI-2E family transporter [Rhodohalobacter sp. SW132]
MTQPGQNEKSLTSGSVAKYTLVVLAILAVTLFIWQIKDALLMAFAGVILAIILGGLSAIVQDKTPLSRTWSLVSVGTALLILFAGFSFLFGAQIVSEFDELTEKLPEQISELRETIRGWPMGEEIVGSENGSDSESESDSEENDENGESETELPEGAGGMIFDFGTTFLDVLSKLGLTLMIGIFFAINPSIYKKGVALLFSKSKTDRVLEAFDTAGNALWRWLTGQFMAMIFVGIAITIGLMIIGVPLPFILGFIAGVSDFVPIIGPIIASIPAILLAFSDGPQTALFTVLLYLVVQQIEGNLLTPIIQKKMVKIPPALVILSVVAFGLVFGIAGIILATPLAVVAMVFVGIFYVQDVLGKEVEIPGRE